MGASVTIIGVGTPAESAGRVKVQPAAHSSPPHRINLIRKREWVIIVALLINRAHCATTRRLPPYTIRSPIMAGHVQSH